MAGTGQRAGRSSGGGGDIGMGRSRGRRSLNEINMVPFIDVMLVLLIIFMVTAPLITTGVVNLPSVGKSQQRASRVIEVIVGTDTQLRLRADGQEPVAVQLAQLPQRVRGLQAGDASMPVVISADKDVRYDQVVRVMDSLQRAGVQRVGLAVKQGGS
jgi:biopolymer transport protein TolR